MHRLKLQALTLHRPSKLVTFDQPARLKVLADKMYALMNKKKGIGLAANQVGLDIQVFVMDVYRPIAYFNPQVLSISKDLERNKEACLSFPGLELMITRPKWITAKWQDYHGKEYIEELHGLEARCFLHENDHLSGITFDMRQAV